MPGTAVRRATATDKKRCTRSSQHEFIADSVQLQELNGDDFKMYGLKVIPCSKAFCHEWSECPFAHRGEKAARRDLRKFHYSGVVCPDMRKNGHCHRGDDCGFAHSIFEYGLHPTRFRTVPCSEGSGCTRKFCFFAHTPEELRKPRLTHAGSTEDAPYKPVKITADEDQGRDLSAHDQHMPAHGGNPSEHGAPLPGSPDKRCTEAHVGGVDESDKCSCDFGKVTAAGDNGNPGVWQSEHAGLAGGFSGQLTHHQLDAFLAGFAYALSQRIGIAWGVPQPQLVPSFAPLNSQGWGADLLDFQQDAEVDCSMARQHIPLSEGLVADVHDRQTLRHPDEVQLGLDWMENAEGCSSFFASAGQSLNTSTSLSGESAPTTYNGLTPPPVDPFNTKWGSPGALQKVLGCDPFTTEAKKLPFNSDSTSHHAARSGGLHHGCSGSTNSGSTLEAPGSTFNDTPEMEQLDPVVKFPCDSILKHAAPFDHLEGLQKTPVLQCDGLPEFSLFARASLHVL
ncbi:probable zinc finger CCCH domain-containing protein 30 at N-terminal half [Coccomyxa sp. Obi]|nr:probable zinc finger CCCH domain-containing protein 30 at N-terminal half [Coccomyxa sp. Obi]